MANELDHVRPAAEHTTINQELRVQESGVEFRSEIQYAEEAHKRISEVGGSIRGETTPLSVVSGEVKPEQFEEPNKNFPADDTKRYQGFASIVNKLRNLKRGGLTNAA